MAKGDSKPERGEEVTNELPPKWEPKEIGDEIEGTYLGSREITASGSTFKTYVIEIDPDTEEQLSFAGGIADRKMARVKKGTYVWVKYNGKIKTTKGKANDFVIVVEKNADLLEESMV